MTNLPRARRAIFGLASILSLLVVGTASGANGAPLAADRSLPKLPAVKLPAVKLPAVKLPPAVTHVVSTLPGGHASSSPAPPHSTAQAPRPASALGSTPTRGAGGGAGSPSRAGIGSAGSPGRGASATAPPARPGAVGSSAAHRPPPGATSRSAIARLAAPLNAAHPVRARGKGNLLDKIGRAIPLPLPVPDWSKPIILVLFLVAVGFALRARWASRSVRRLQGHQQQLAAELDSMQTALVPKIAPRLGELDLSVAYRPADGPAGGGDFYDAFIRSDGAVAIILGDVSGHGRDSLAHATHMRYALRAYLEAGVTPRVALKLANHVVEPDRPELFTTAVVAIYDAGRASLTYAVAGHPRPLTSGTNAAEGAGRGRSPALGWGVSTGRRQTTVPFPESARACFFSDGLTEARTDRGMLGRDGLSEVLTRIGEDPSAPALLERVREAATETPDDMVACVIQAASGAPESATLLEELEVDAAQVERGDAHDFLVACGVPSERIAPALGRARAVVARNGHAVLRVALNPDGSADEVSAGAAETGTIEPKVEWPAEPGEPSATSPRRVPSRRRLPSPGAQTIAQMSEVARSEWRRVAPRALRQQSPGGPMRAQ